MALAVVAKSAIANLRYGILNPWEDMIWSKTALKLDEDTGWAVWYEIPLVAVRSQAGHKQDTRLMLLLKRDSII